MSTAMSKRFVVKSWVKKDYRVFFYDGSSIDIKGCDICEDDSVLEFYIEGAVSSRFKQADVKCWARVR